jgi:nucleotide-binding universal stress UspA family protein
VNVKTVIYATDLSVCCKNAGQYAAFLARHFSAKLLIVHAFILSQAALEVEIDPELVSEQRKDLEFLLARTAERQRGQGLEAESLLQDGDPRKILPELADQYSPCLLVVGTHGGGWVERELIGSVAETVVHSAPCPVLTVGPHVKGGHPDFRHVLYRGDSHIGAESCGVWFARQFNARFEHAPVGNQDEILQQVRNNAADLLVLGGQKVADLSGAYGLMVRAPCPVLTLLS